MQGEGVLQGYKSPRAPASQPGRVSRLSWLRRIDWLTLALLMVNMWIVVWTVELGQWVQTPSLTRAVTVGALLALALSRVRVHAVFLHPPALLFGALFVVWSVSTLSREPTMVGQLTEVLTRIGSWFGAASGGGISIDPLPFAIALVSLSWLIGYISAWAIFRHKSFWVGILPGGLAIITNLAYLPSAYITYFFLYGITAALLLARIYNLERRAEWAKKGYEVAPQQSYGQLYDALWLATAMVIVAFILPTGDVNKSWTNVYEVTRTPIRYFQSDFNRLFGSLPGRKAMPYRTFDSSLPFRGTIRLGTDPVLEIFAPYAMYWRARSYANYTSQGWRDDQAATIPSMSSTQLPRVENYFARQEVTYEVHPADRLTQVFVGGQVEPQFGVMVSSYESPRYTIDLRNAQNDAALPTEIRVLARQLRQLGTRVTDQRTFERAMPAETSVLHVERDGTSRIIAVTIVRAAPVDPLAVEIAGRGNSADPYTLTATASIAQAWQLRGAGTQYPAWIRDRYLQLPASVPQRVRNLAIELTRSAPTPYDKALAIEAYLKSMEYSLDIEAPPHGTDAIDFFLFEQRKGYSEYFGSAMAVLLRAAGVPARMAAGYAPGELTERGTFLVRDGDSHGWVQVWFPDYGWVDFEPTPGKELPAPVIPELSYPIGEFPAADPPLFEEDPFVPSERPEVEVVPLPGPTLAERLSALLPWLVVPLVTALIGYLAWRIWLGPPAAVETAFNRMGMLGALAGAGPRRHNTPYEFARVLGARVPDAAGDVHTVADLYTRQRYGGRTPTGDDRVRMTQAWLRMRRALLWRIVKRW